VANLKSTCFFLGAIFLTIVSSQIALGQCTCPEPITLTIGAVTISPCTAQRLDIPVYIHNECYVGGFEIRIHTTDPSWLAFSATDTAAADTIGSRIGNWEMFSANVYSSNTSQIIISGIADWPGGAVGVKLPPGDGLLFTMHINYLSRAVCDSAQLLTFTLGRISDTTGNCLIDNVELISDSVHVLAGNCNDNPRGDANCSGALTGSDVTYLVRFFKGLNEGYCCLCSGDVNNSGTVSGVDVTYLVGYFKGQRPHPAPCR
jgi:hypothetical protein